MRQLGVKWSNFIDSSNWHLEKSIEIRDKEEEYDLKIKLD